MIIEAFAALVRPDQLIGHPVLALALHQHADGFAGIKPGVDPANRRRGRSQPSVARPAAYSHLQPPR